MQGYTCILSGIRHACEHALDSVSIPSGSHLFTLSVGIAYLIYLFMHSLNISLVVLSCLVKHVVQCGSHACLPSRDLRGCVGL